MKTIIEISTNESKYLESDETVINLFEDRIEVGDPIVYTVGDLNSQNAIVVENVTGPEDWLGCKYLYVNGAWELCPDWVDPRLEQSV